MLPEKLKKPVKIFLKLSVLLILGFFIYKFLATPPVSGPRKAGLLPPQQLSILDQISKYFLASVSGSNIIVISGANELDENKKIIAEIYSKVAHQDGTYAEIQSGHYIRATFERELINTNDITLYAKGTGTVEVYKKDSSEKIMSFDIAGENYYRQVLTNMSGTSDSFDLKSVGDISYDFITDPSWTCGDALVDSRDSQNYATVAIGSQCWMAQNLNVGTRVAASATQTTTCAAGNGSDIQKYCYGDTDGGCTRNTSTGNDGGLYQWNQTMCGSASCNGTGSGQPACATPVQGICPTGWHVPSHYEWTLLELNVCAINPTDTSCAAQFPYDTTTTSGGTTTEAVGTKLQIKDATHFSGLLAGWKYVASFSEIGSRACFWSSFERGSNVWDRSMTSGSTLVSRSTCNVPVIKTMGLSLRCVYQDSVPLAVTTGAATFVGTPSLTGNGNVTSDGGVAVTDRGFYYVTDSSNGSCTGASDGTQVTAGSGAGAYTALIGSLSANTYYCYRAYATSSAGTAYGSWTSFQTIPWTCGQALVDPRDSQSYATVAIGSQCWMAQNLNVGTRVAASATQTTTCASGNGSDIQKYCQGNTDGGCTRNTSTGNDGGLYQWNQTMCGSASCNGTGSGQPACTTPVQGICPAGWHVPSHYEWTLLELTVCAQNPTDSSCAAQFPYNTTTSGYQGTTAEMVGTKLQVKDSTHFSALLAGREQSGVLDTPPGTTAYFWSSLAGSSVWYRRLDSGATYVLREGAISKANGNSLRCVSPNLVTLAVTTGTTTGVGTPALTGNGNVTADGGATVTDRGFYYVTDGSNGSCTGASDGTQVTAGSGTGAYTANIGSLSANTYYCYRAYATNSAGTAYGSWTSFQTTVSMGGGGTNVVGALQFSGSGLTIGTLTTPSWACGDTLIDSRDNKNYTTVLIGTQCWMAQNLNVGNIIGSKLVDNATYQNQTDNNDAIEKYCYGYVQQDNPLQITSGIADCNVWGGLYQWPETVQYSSGVTLTSGTAVASGNIQGICPVGWHVPSSAEFTTLSTYLGATAGGKMKEAGLVHWTTPNTGATNSSGFTGIPSGNRSDFQAMSERGTVLNMWTTLASGTGSASRRGLGNTDASLSQNDRGRGYGLSVRCLKN